MPISIHARIHAGNANKPPMKGRGGWEGFTGCRRTADAVQSWRQLLGQDGIGFSGASFCAMGTWR